MNILKIVLGVLAALAVVVAIAAPIGPLPGFFIGGAAQPAPAAWPDTSGVHEIKLKVAGGIPRVVIIWVADYNGELYVVGSPDSGWVRKVGDGAPVQLRLGDDTYALNAVPVAGNTDAILNAWLDKYEPDYPEIVSGFREGEASSSAAAIFRLDR